MDGLLLDVTMPPDTMELLFARQMEMSEQCKNIMEEYRHAIQKGTLVSSYAHLRREVEDRIEILRKRKKTKRMNQAAGQAMAVTGKGGKVIEK